MTTTDDSVGRARVGQQRPLRLHAARVDRVRHQVAQHHQRSLLDLWRGVGQQPGEERDAAALAHFASNARAVVAKGGVDDLREDRQRLLPLLVVARSTQESDDVGDRDDLVQHLLVVGLVGVRVGVPLLDLLLVVGVLQLLLQVQGLMAVWCSTVVPKVALVLPLALLCLP